MWYSNNQYNSLTSCVFPEQGGMQGETTANCKMKLLGICVCATTIIICTNHLPPVFVQNRVTCKEKQQQ